MSDERSLRAQFAALPAWGRVLLTALGLWFAFALVFALLWLLGVCLMVVPWFLFFVVALLQSV